MIRKAVISLLFVTLGYLCLSAQNDYRNAFKEFAENAKSLHAAFSDSANVVFSKAIGAEWTMYELSDGNKRQVNPEPETLPVAEETQTVFRVVNVSETVDTFPAHWPFETGSSLWKQNVPSKRNDSKVIRFVFYDSDQVVAVPKEYGCFHPTGISESEVAAFWAELSKYDYRFILDNCAKYIELYGYNDWAVLEWVRELSSAVFPQNIYSEQTIFTVFLLNQMGLMTKLARADSCLICLFSSMQPVYARKFVIIDTYPFYVAESDFSASEVFTYSADFMKPSRPLDLRIQVSPSFGTSSSFKTYHKHSSLFNASFDLPINQSLIRFYESYPQTAINVYASAQPDSRFAKALLMAIGGPIKGLSFVDAVNQLLAFVQTDFGYQTDIIQFGYEKPFFCEENFVYGSNDCEDRAVLFAYLVQTILGKKVVLLEYPDHVSTAVRLDGDIKGDYVRIGNERFFVCDPSYIGSSLGMTMPKYKNKSVKVYVLQ